MLTKLVDDETARNVPPKPKRLSIEDRICAEELINNYYDTRNVTNWTVTYQWWGDTSNSTFNPRPSQWLRSTYYE